jgi:hypothetical protein
MDVVKAVDKAHSYKPLFWSRDNPKHTLPLAAFADRKCSLFRTQPCCLRNMLTEETLLGKTRRAVSKGMGSVAMWSRASYLVVSPFVQYFAASLRGKCY